MWSICKKNYDNKQEKRQENCYYVTISENFNAKVGESTENKENINIRLFSLEERNKITKGQILRYFIAAKNLFCLNTFI